MEWSCNMLISSPVMIDFVKNTAGALMLVINGLVMIVF